MTKNILNLTDFLRTRHSDIKRCDHHKFELDEINKVVECIDCKKEIPPYDALFAVAKKFEVYETVRKQKKEEIAALEKEIEMLKNWNPHLKAVRELERNWRGKVMLPCCPHCHQGIDAHEFTGFVNRDVEMQRRKFKKK